MFRVLFTRRAEKQLVKLPQKYQQRLLEEIMRLSMNPYIGKKLHGEREGEYSWKCWPYRIIYVVEKKRVMVIVLEIGHRQGVYK